VGQPAASPGIGRTSCPDLAPLGALIVTLGISLLLDSGLAVRTASHRGRSYQAVNCCETLSDSLVSVDLLEDSDLRCALKSGR
jgi:hypothetical protein